jgi:hypothetical protein
VHDKFSTNEIGSAVVPCPQPAGDAARPVTWIGIEMVGEDGQPICWEEYSITLPTGEVVRGYLDDKGIAKVQNILNPGMCKVTFPRLDEEAWKKIG